MSAFGGKGAAGIRLCCSADAVVAFPACERPRSSVTVILLAPAMEHAMKKTTLAIAAAAAVAMGTISAPTTADAYCYGCGVGAGVAGGLIAGAIIGGAIANSQPRYYGGPAYYGGPVYNGPPPGDAVAYCMQRFRSYDPRSGTYLGNDGFRHPCP